MKLGGVVVLKGLDNLDKHPGLKLLPSGTSHIHHHSNAILLGDPASQGGVKEVVNQLEVRKEGSVVVQLGVKEDQLGAISRAANQSGATHPVSQHPF